MTILLDKKELEQLLNQNRTSKWIELSIVPAQTEKGQENPTFLHIGAIHANGTYEDLEGIDEIPSNEQPVRISA